MNDGQARLQHSVKNTICTHTKCADSINHQFHVTADDHDQGLEEILCDGALKNLFALPRTFEFFSAIATS